MVKEGLIEVTLEAPRIVRVRFTGMVDAPDATHMAEQTIRAVGHQPYAILCETPDLKGLTPAARKQFATEFGRLPLVCVAMLRPSLPTRALATFIVAAINILRPKQRMELAFFEDDVGAVTWATAQLAARG
jgi:hypothetical protein